MIKFRCQPRLFCFWLTNTKEVLNFKSMPEIFTADEVADNPSGVADSATRAEQLLERTDQLDVTDPGWRYLLQPPDQTAPHGYQEFADIEEVLVQL